MFIEEHARPKTRRWQATARLLGLRPDTLESIPGGLLERWSDRPIACIDGHDVWSVIDEARRIGIPGITARNPGLSDARARALLATLSGLFGWLLRHRRVAANPCAGVHRPAPPRARERVLTSDEIRWMWHATEVAGEPFASIFKLLLLLGSRLNEVGQMMRQELREDGTWQLPGERTKNRRSHVVPLPRLAREIIANVPATAGLVFGTNGGRTAPSNWSRPKRRLDAAMLAAAKRERGAEATVPPWRLHDLRRTFVTGLIEAGVQPHVVEKIVNHVSGHQAGVAGIYNKSELLDDRRAALERWAAHVEVMVLGQSAKVVTLDRRRN